MPKQRAIPGFRDAKKNEVTRSVSVLGGDVGGGFMGSVWETLQADQLLCITRRPQVRL